MNSWIEVGKKVTLLLVVASLGFGAHASVNHFFAVDVGLNNLQFAYIVNLVLATISLVLFMRLPQKLQGNLGFLFLGSSMVKFLVFFLVFYPVYKADGDVSKLEFATFFAPYAICLIVETTVLVRMLNKQT